MFQILLDFPDIERYFPDIEMFQILLDFPDIVE